MLCKLTQDQDNKDMVFSVFFSCCLAFVANQHEQEDLEDMVQIEGKKLLSNQHYYYRQQRLIIFISPKVRKGVKFFKKLK